MKRKHPHIIVRFSKNVPPPSPGPPPQHTAQHQSSRRTGDAAAAASKTAAGATIDMLNVPSGDTKRKRAKIQSRDDAKKAGSSKRDIAPPTSTPSSPQLIGKRKRDVPESIGGGKGDLQPPTTRNARRQALKNDSATQTQTEGKKDGQKRVLRSQDTKQKSDFSGWFEDTGDEEAIKWDTQMMIIEEDEGIDVPVQKTKTRGAAKAVSNALTNCDNVGNAGYTNGSSTSGDANTSAGIPQVPHDPVPAARNIPIETIDVESLARNMRASKFTSDPLSDDIYFKPHRTKEREEKRIRNIEREQFSHNKQKLEETLEKLKGSDWMKALGLAATGAKADKKMEKKRKLLIEDLEATMLKFQKWREEERRLRLLKGRNSSGTPEKISIERETPPEDQTPQDSADEDAEVKSDVPEEDEWDVPVPADEEDDDDEEGEVTKRRRIGPKSLKPKKVPPRPAASGAPKLVKKEPEFTSFYNKDHMRAAAVSNWRKTPRKQTAFGYPLPDLDGKEFELPEEYIQDSARYTRARKRERTAV